MLQNTKIMNYSLTADGINLLTRNRVVMKLLRSKIDLEMYASCGIFGITLAYIAYKKQFDTVGLAIGVFLVLYVITDNNTSVSLIAGAIVGLVALYYSRSTEGFENESEDEEETVKEEEKPAEVITEEVKKPKKKSKTPPPDNGERAEFLTLGKKYKIPSESDDKEFHLDAGTTFMNAYKSLKPDQLAAMTKDTQELMQTQKQLMGTLQTLKPLITDGKEMMDMFQSYFGSGGMTGALTGGK
jgi:uncharacterized membrane protein (DUF106 family)